MASLGKDKLAINEYVSLIHQTSTGTYIHDISSMVISYMVELLCTSYR